MKAILAIITVLVTSLYFFPIEFSFLPGINTKLAMGGLGAIVFMYDLARQGRAIFDKGFLMVLVFSLVVSFCGLISVIINNTPDYSYAGYVFSMLTWFAGAYVIVRIISGVHGSVNVRLITNYLTAVCVMQCVAVILNDNFPSFKDFVDTYVNQGQDFINGLVGTKRKYGIGANLDTAGVRFSAVLCMISVVASKLSDELKKKWLWLYIISFLFIAIEGNFVARTTIAGVGLALLYALLNLKSYKTRSVNYNSGLYFSIVSILVLGTSLVVYLYNTDEKFEEDMRFGFEGFFSLVEKGEWSVSSNDRLESMYVYPDNMKTWAIGDGYFSNPINTDPFFIGEITGGYYKGTDVGFLRFIYYFGLMGLASFAIFFYKCAQVCSSEYPKYKYMFYILMLLNFIIWLKVSTDLFLVFALFIAGNIVRNSRRLDMEEEFL